MISYVKLWTTIYNDSWYLSLNSNGRGIWLGLIVWAKMVGDTGIVTFASWTAMGSTLGCDGKTARKFTGFFRANGKVDCDLDTSPIVIKIVKYQQYQELRNDKEWRENNQPQGIFPYNNNKNNNKNKNKSGKEISEKISYEDIIKHLNKIANTNYKSDSKKTQSLIKARFNDGFKLEDFIYVNEIKTSEWLNTDMEKFLRPETLYSNKFEGYRQQKPHKDLKTPITSQQEQKHYESKKRVLPKLPSEQQYWNNLTSEEQTEWRNLPIPKKTISEFYIERHGELCLSR